MSHHFLLVILSLCFGSGRNGTVDRFGVKEEVFLPDDHGDVRLPLCQLFTTGTVPRTVSRLRVIVPSREETGQEGVGSGGDVSVDSQSLGVSGGFDPPLVVEEFLGRAQTETVSLFT